MFLIGKFPFSSSLSLRWVSSLHFILNWWKFLLLLPLLSIPTFRWLANVNNSFSSQRLPQQHHPRAGPGQCRHCGSGPDHVEGEGAGEPCHIEDCQGARLQCPHRSISVGTVQLEGATVHNDKPWEEEEECSRNNPGGGAVTLYISHCPRLFKTMWQGVGLSLYLHFNVCLPLTHFSSFVLTSFYPHCDLS